MQLKTKLTSGLAAAGVALSLMAGGAAYGAEDDSSGQDAADLRATAIENGVPAEKVESLVDKVLDGEALDSLSGTAQPVSVDEYDKDGSSITVERYADGSYMKTSVEIPTEPDGGFQALDSLSQCNRSTSGSWQVAKGCLAKWDFFAGNFQHRVDARYIAGLRGAGEITNVWGASAGGVGVTGSHVEIGRSSGNPAISVGVVNMQGPGIGSSATCELHVSRNGIEPQPCVVL